ncbi:MAG: SDR family oxidoreductase [Rhodobacteraceae bacterium]|nr:SDR family oxidoreductase [Paracoccaceae bacterium]RZO36220.1 MAG: SDR family oxidoreductase [Paracoccaceae bacterium]|tara:strand:+ start:57 stop:809 length:753 start_codon:yes stop_codon:yes gene_type:complete
MTDLTGQTALITGASRGIGAETARAFAAAGATLCLIARSADELKAVAAELGTQTLVQTCDISDYTSVSAAVDATIKTFGQLDIVINNAGAIEPISHLSSVDPDGWDKVIDVNLKGVFYAMRAALPHMLGRGSGTIITVSSGAAHNPVEAWSHYCASKAGAAMLTECLHLENGASGIRAMGMSPGTVATQMQRDIKASGINPVSQLNWSDHIPADWPAKALLWMCSAAADGYLGREISLRDDDIRKAVGLI